MKVFITFLFITLWAESYCQRLDFLAPNHNNAGVYQTNVKALTPLVYWPLNETVGTVARNAMNNSAYDGASNNVYLKNVFYLDYAYHFSTSYVNIYSSSLNTNMNKAEGTISLWFRLSRKEDWTPATATERLLSIESDDNNRFVVDITNASVLRCIRIAGGNAEIVSNDYSATKPLDWINVVMTYSVASDQFKMFINGVQVGSTQTSIGTFSGALSSTKCVLGAQTTAPAVVLTEGEIAHVAIFNSVLSAGNITILATGPTYPPGQYVQHSIRASWDIFSLFGITGSTMACFAYDVNGDGLKEFVGNIGRRARFVAVEQNGNVLWDNTVNNTQAEGLRFPQIRSGILYYGWTNHACAINMTNGATVWNKTPMVSPPASGLGGLNQSSAGLVIAVGNKLDILNYSTGNSIGGNFPVTLPFDQWEQSLSVGIFGTSTEVIVCNDNFNNMIVFNIDGTIRFQKGPLVGTVNWVNENDWYEFFDYRDTGSNVLGLVGDDDATTTQPALEGDEFHIYGNTGTQLDKYDDGIHTGGLEFHSYAWPNGGRVVFTHESDYANKRITMLDKNLNELWAKNAGSPYEGDQCVLLDVDSDGIPEILYSTEVFSETGGFRVLDYRGNSKQFFSTDSPNVLDDIVDGMGAAVNINVSRAPYYWTPDEFIQFTHRTTDNAAHEMIYLHKWEIVNR